MYEDLKAIKAFFLGEIMMKREFTIVLAVALLALLGSESWATMYVEGTLPLSDPMYVEGMLPPDDYGTLGTAWDPGANTASFRPAPIAPGGATFSIMGDGLTADFGYGASHTGTTSLITALGVPGYTAADYAADISAALDVWAAPSLFTNLGEVADGGVNAAATQASGGHLGDIRVAAWEIGASGVLAHAYQPAIEGMFTGGTIGGDMHFDVDRSWADDPTDTTADADFDFFTIALHELGHSLGLDHSTDPSSVMYMYYSGARRTLTADDIAGIQAIYGVVPVPGAVLLGIIGLSVAGVKLRRFA
jgi:hypothetical protein